MHAVTTAIDHEAILLQSADDSARTGRPASVGHRVLAWEMHEQLGVFRCEVRFQEESDGGFSVYVPALPGVASQGNSLEEAERNIREALSGALETYLSYKKPIPWLDQYPVRAETDISKWVLVNA